MKKVLIITYYWPPSGGAGVQRWLKFVKYLRDFGWEPVIYTPENPEAPAVDLSLLKDVPENIEVLKTRIWEPYSAYKKLVGRKNSDKIKSGFLNERKNPSFAEKLSVWVRGNLFIPDARKYWIKPSVRFLTTYVKNHHVDAIVSTGPPHSMHLIALGVKQNTNLPWLADFRDPWTSIDFYQELKLSKKSDKRHHQLEKLVLKTADQVVVVSNGMKLDFNNLFPRSYEVITNGSDGLPASVEKAAQDKRFSVAHIGSMVPARNPEILWKALHELSVGNPKFAERLEIKLIGQVDYSVKDSIAQFGLASKLHVIDYIPHDEVIVTQQQVEVLLLLINDTPSARLVVTGKIFEYIHSGRPVLCIGPTDGDAASILSETNTGITVDFNDLKGLKMVLLSYFVKYQQGELNVESRNTDKFLRKNLTSKMALLLNSL